MSGRPQRDVDHEDRDAEHPADLGQEPGEPGQPELELGLWVALAEARRRSARTGSTVRSRRRRHQPSPSCTTVPMNRHDDSSASAEPAATGVGRLDRRDRLTGEDRLVAFEVARGEQPDVGGHDRAHVEVHDVTGHQVGDLHARRLAVAEHGDDMADSECIASAARSARYSLAKPETDRRRDDDPDDHGVEPLADDGRHHRRGEQQPQQRAAHLTRATPTRRSRDGIARHSVRTPPAVPKPPPS